MRAGGLPGPAGVEAAETPGQAAAPSWPRGAIRVAAGRKGALESPPPSLPSPFRVAACASEGQALTRPSPAHEASPIGPLMDRPLAGAESRAVERSR